MRQLNNHFGRRCASTPMAVHRVKVTFKDEPGEGSGVARSFYTAIAQALLSNEKLPNLDCIQNASKGTHTSKCSTDFRHRNYNSLFVIINGNHGYMSIHLYFRKFYSRVWFSLDKTTRIDSLLFTAACSLMFVITPSSSSPSCYLFKWQVVSSSASLYNPERIVTPVLVAS